ncbi:MAG: NAD(P)-dependent oxidoreductase [Bacilli bacterium]|nr:NAD(P)-dependent oxidoreductase [Bacilli bacterium]
MAYHLKKVVISGATGTIGVALTNLFTSEGVDCVLLNMPGITNPKAYSHPERITFIDCLLTDYSSLMQIPTDCDAFIHLSWAGTFGPNRDDTTLQVQNIKGVMDALDLAKRMGCKAFVGAGSQAEYGKGVESEDRPLMPVTGYGMAKLAAGQLGKLKASQIGIRFNWIRIFSVYGPFSGAGSLTQYIVSTLLKGESPKLTKCEQIWDFLYTEDAVRAIAAVADKGLDGKTYELGSGVTGTIRSFVEPIPQWLGINLPIEFGALEYPPNQIMKMCAHVDELKKDTGWAPTVSFEEGIRKVAASLK